MLMLLFTGTLKAETTWIPISNGGNFIIIPFIPNYTLPAPSNFGVVGGLLAWDDIKHASKYLIQGKTANGEWKDLLLTEYTFVNFDHQFFGFEEVRVQACTYNSCIDSGYLSNLLIGNLIKFPKKRFEYDALGRLIKVRDSVGTDTDYEYDAAGNRKVVKESKHEE